MPTVVCKTDAKAPGCRRAVANSAAHALLAARAGIRKCRRWSLWNRGANSAWLPGWPENQKEKTGPIGNRFSPVAHYYYSHMENAPAWKAYLCQANKRLRPCTAANGMATGPGSCARSLCAVSKNPTPNSRFDGPRRRGRSELEDSSMPEPGKWRLGNAAAEFYENHFVPAIFAACTPVGRRGGINERRVDRLIELPLTTGERKR
jgi:hypothetical protein